MLVSGRFECCHLRDEIAGSRDAPQPIAWYTSAVTHSRCISTPSVRATPTFARFRAFLAPRSASFSPHRPHFTSRVRLADQHVPCLHERQFGLRLPAPVLRSAQPDPRIPAESTVDSTSPAADLSCPVPKEVDA